MSQFLSRQFILKSLENQSPVEFKSIPKNLQTDFHFLQQCLQVQPQFFYELPEDLQKEEKIYLCAFKHDVEIRSFTTKIQDIFNFFPSTEVEGEMPQIEILQENSIPEFLRTKEIVFNMIKHGVSSEILDILPESERDENNEEWKEFMKQCVKVNISTFFFENNYKLFNDDVEIVKKAIQQVEHTTHLNKFLNEFISEKLKNDKEIRRELSLLCLQQNFQFVKYLDVSLKEDEFVLEYIKKMKHPLLLKNKTFQESLMEYENCTSKVFNNFDLKFKNKSFLKAAVRNNGMFLKFMSDQEKHQILKLDFNYSPPECIKHAPFDFKSSNEIMEFIVKQNGFCLEFAHESIQTDEIALLALKQVSTSSISIFHQELFMKSLQSHESEDFISQALDINKNYLKFVSSNIITENLLKKALNLDFEYYRYCFEIPKFSHLKTYKNKFQIDTPYKKFIEITNDQGLILNYLKSLNKLNFYNKLSPVFKNSYEFNMKAVKCNGLVLQFLHENFIQDFDIVLEAVTQNADSLIPFNHSKPFENHPKIIIQQLKQGKHKLNLMNESLKINMNIIIQALLMDGLDLEFVPKHLKNKETVLLAVGNNGMSLEFAPEELKRDFDVVYKAVSNNKESIQFALLDADVLKELQEEFEISETEEYKVFEVILEENQDIVEIVEKNENSVDFYKEHYNEVTENDFKFMEEENILKSLETNPFNLKKVPKEKQNQKMVDLAVSKCGMILEYVKIDSLKTEKLIEMAVSDDGMSLKFATEEFKNNLEIVSKAIKQNPSSLQYASDQLKKRKSLVLEAISFGDGSCLQYADNTLKSDEKIVRESLKKNGHNLIYTFIEGKSNFDTDEFILEAAKNDKDILNVPLFQHHGNKKELIKKLIDIDSSFFGNASTDIKMDSDVFLKAVQKGFSLKNRDPDSELTPEIIECAISNNANEIYYIDSSIISFDSFKKWIYLNHRCFKKYGWMQFTEDELIELCFASIESSQPPNNSGYNLRYFPSSINEEKLRKLLIRCLKSNSRVFDIIPNYPHSWSNFKNDKELILLGRGYKCIDQKGDYLSVRFNDMYFNFKSE
jgi:hypothetical protein